MSTALQSFNPASLAVALKQVARAAQSSAAFLKMEKTGTWVYGIDANEVPEDMAFYVHPAGFQHGYVAWESDNGGTKLGEVMGPVNEEIPPTGPVPDGADGWQFQLGIGLMSVDDREAMVYRATSVGGKRAIANLGTEISGKLESGDPKCVPLVTLSSESYKHKKYGKIFNPVITITGWATVEQAAEEAPTKPAVKALPPAKKAKKAA
jgi:hypothetical protein